ncbi:MAG: hypothetical protein QOD66_1819, partial [Solirubrobacteraceae bacterium]|nr:hypothetical protein [Solirubrobacteraceae bacterium]
MRRSEDETIDPEVAAQLDAIDATLAGDAVDPRHAELAELALLLAAERPEPDDAFARELDGRVAVRFGTSARSGSGSGSGSGSPSVVRPGSRRVRSWMSLPVLGSALAAGAAAVVAVVALGSGGSGGPKLLTEAKRPLPTVTTMTSSTSSAASGAASSAASSPASSAGASGSVVRRSPGAVFGPAQNRALQSPGSPSAGGVSSAALAPAPTPNGRKIVQSAQLALSTGASHVDDVAQEVFNVVGSEHGIVSSSNVTATGGLDGYAHFELSLPSGSLSDAMGRLSRLRYGSVSSRTDTTQDVNGRFVSAGRRLADAQALRTALLKQLTSAATTTQISSLRAQIRDAERAIANAQADLRDLNHQVNFSQVSVTVAAT